MKYIFDKIILVLAFLSLITACSDSNITLPVEEVAVQEAPVQEAPVLVGAISTNNTSVIVTYSNEMDDEAENALNYSIVSENINSEAGSLSVVSAAFFGSDRKTVLLTTLSQNEITYKVTAVNVKDMSGQQLLVKSTSTGFHTADNASFAGSPPNSTDISDFDGDGLSDNEEQLGYTIFIEMANGEVIARQVTSDPTLDDTDGDGVSDALELQYGTNPRDSDTDGDTLDDNLELNTIFSNPYAQDSDLDGLQDGFEHTDLHTSPLLADSDGDKLNDSVELFELNRNPRIADLPNLKITVGDVRLQIDERYSYTDESGETITHESSSNTTLAKSQNNSFSEVNSHTLEFTGGASIRAGFGVGFYAGDGYGAGVEGTISAGFSDSNTLQTDEASARESQQVYENSLTKGKELSTTSTVSREIVGARIDIDLSITNKGNIPFNVSNIEITVLQQVGNQAKFLPVATLVSNSELITGTPLQVNLGAFTSERGPFLFTSRDVFPSLVEALMRNPSGLVFRVANYDISDELGRNYAFTNQVARDRTASITLDYGDADAAKNYLVATNGANDDENIAGGGYLGGFSGNGSSLGLPISYVLQNILKIPRQDTALNQIAAGVDNVLDSAGANLKGDDVVQTINGNEVITAGTNGWLETKPTGDDFVANPAVANSIVAGLNKTANSIAAGDDIQLVPVDTKGLSIGTVVIAPGINGVLDTPNLKDDSVDFVNGYETGRSCSALSNKASDICRIDTDCACELGDTDLRCTRDPVPAVQGSCSGPERLVRVNSLRNGDFNRAWVVLTSGNLQAAADFDQIIVKPGTDLSLNFLQDLDKDGIYARNEFLFGSTDSSADVYNNKDFGENFDQSLVAECPAPCDGYADSRDSDRDGLDDFAEIYVGWKVAADGGALKQVFSSPRFRDTDSDGLLDPIEQDLRRYCSKWDDYLGSSAGVPVIGCGANLTVEVKAVGDDVQLAEVGDICAVSNNIIITAGPDGVLDTFPGALAALQGTIVPDTRTDALCSFQSETVLIDDAISIIAGPDGIANTTADANDDQLISVGTAVPYGTAVVGKGTDGVLTTALVGDDIYESQSSIPPATDPSSSDTDLDDISDFIELNGFSAGLAVIDGGNGIAETVKNGDDIQRAFIDNPVFPGSVLILPGQNGVIDSVPGGNDLIRLATDGLVSDPLRRDTDNDLFADGLELVLGSDPTISDAGDFIDSDLDGLTDKEESSLGWLVSVDGGADFLVKSGPSLPDTDFDGLPDFVERDLRTNPNNADTDGDGISDYDEINDLSKYAAIAALYPNLNIVATTTSGYGTDPTLTDTDGDGLSDKEELIDGFRLALPGSSGSTIIYTQALFADTDLDNINDGDEIDNGTDPTNPDTDGDGRNDGSEVAAGSDPFVPDRVILIRYTNMQLTAGSDGASYAWQMYVQAPAQSYPGSLVTNSFIHHQNTDRDLAHYTPNTSTSFAAGNRYLNSLISGHYCGYVGNLGNLSNIWLGSYAERQIVMHQGDTVTISGSVYEYKNCTDASGFAIVDSINNFRKTFSYDEIVGGTGTAGVIDTQSVSGTDSQAIGYEIIIR